MFDVEIDIVSRIRVVSWMMFVVMESSSFPFVEVDLVVLRLGVVVRGL